jgi:CP family cyanate transporter-like MFS transporter
VTDGRASRRHPYRWVIFGAMSGVYVAFGLVMLAIPPMVTQVRTDLGLTRGEIGFAIGAWAVMYIVTAPPAGRIIDRVGLHRSLGTGALLIATSAAVQAAAPNGLVLWFAVAIAGVGGPLVSLSAPKLVAIWFVDAAERPMAVGFYTSAPALGGVASLLLTNSVLLPLFGGWRAVLLAESVFVLVTGVAWLVVSGRAPTPPRVADIDGSVAAGGAPTVRTLLRSHGVQLAMALGIGTFFITQGLAAWLPDILEQRSGLSTGAASNWAAVSLAVGLGSRLVMPGLATAERRSRMLQVTMGVLVLAMVAMAFGAAAVGVTAAVVLGLRSVLNSLVVVVLMEAEHVSAANAATAYGLWFSVVEVGGALGPVVIGALGDSALGFEGALVAMAVMLALMMTALAVADRRRPRVVAPAAAV